LLPFLSGQKVDYVVALEPGRGFERVHSPTPCWPIPYRVKGSKPFDRTGRLYVTTQLRTALRLGSLGYSAWAVQSPNQLQGPWLKQMETLEVVYCQDASGLSSERLQPFYDLLNPVCRRFRWQSLGQVETEWIIVQSREERAQPSGPEDLRKTRTGPELMRRLAQKFKRQKANLLQLFSL
jgi:hypothetical protein